MAPCGIMFILAERVLLSGNILLSNRSMRIPNSTNWRSLFFGNRKYLDGSFLSAFSQVTDLVFNLSVPVLARDMLGAVLSSALLESGYYADKVLVVETSFLMRRSIKVFFILPELEALDKILNGRNQYLGGILMGKRVLIVDDAAFMRMMIKDIW